MLEGFNGSIMAYGQTSSGKTHTMQGDLDSAEAKGIIPRIVDAVFQRIEETSAKVEFTIKSSMIEIYNEKVRDLLDPSKDNLSIREERTRGVFIDNLTDVSIGTADEVYELMKQGNNNRAVGVTNMNAQSSRSHSIFIMQITMNDLENYSCRTGKLYLVDLAGSEIVSKTGAMGKTLEEAKNINKSLTTLGRVINALTDGKSEHVPYRDSKLTRILQTSLGGNSKTCLIITASPAMYNSVETLSTCRFGMRAKSIKNNARVNKIPTVAELERLVKQLTRELNKSNHRVSQLEALIASTGGSIPADDSGSLFPEEESERADTVASEDPSNEDPKISLGGEDSKEPEAKAVPGLMSPPAATSTSSPNKAEEDEEEKKKTPSSAKDSSSPPKTQEALDALEKQNEERTKDVDTLIDQLRKERKRTRTKDQKIRLISSQLAEQTEEVKRLRAAQETLKAVQQSKPAPEPEQKQPEPQVQVLIQPVPVQTASVLEKLLANPEVDEKTKAIIRASMNEAPKPEETTVTAKKEEGKEEKEEKEEKEVKEKGKTYTVAEVKSTLEAEIKKEREGYVEERQKIVDRVGELSKKTCDLTLENERLNDALRRLQLMQSKEYVTKHMMVMQENLLRLNQMYHQKLNQWAASKCDLETQGKQMKRMQEMKEDMSRQVSNMRDQVNATSAQCDQLKELIRFRVPEGEKLLESPLLAQINPMLVGPQNVIKAIRGGGKGFRVSSGGVAMFSLTKSSSKC